ncbi:hypothetical protein TanjilG_09827 [Lupinus angustifolius]|uniref:DUF1639 family protein n=2 Tax=Lupinus angustifolius TaxID=3871 RepID=A0A4P1QWN5_LUPAN|nr:PREDICTED: uncharacterized protein LOC109327914 isoform X2 [Lupinus angustifolius]XP_019416633.1 PREDICTED: uncharacterized protein LOC109327914 isoform X2 [Lupinus angustifolius]XP_019416634.1 PREDICTED: uncharacterized protein LOC109327914 isoform X2 [Lupinus angustifolius]OIV96400.1 hypothetical protein TanjilG_09827 [Lupinus angustifolius]
MDKGEGSSLVLRASSDNTRHATTSDLVLQWGNRKRLRCMKVQVKDHSSSNNVNDNGSLNNNNKPTVSFNITNTHQNQSYGFPNLRQRQSSPHQRILRNWETSSAMRGVQSNGGDKRGTHNNTLFNDNNKLVASSDTAHDSKKGGSPSGSGDGAPPVWPPKFVIALTNKEKEEDFLAIKGSKLPQRPKKRAKLVQRTLNQVSPGTWLCDLTLERYEVREKKINKKRPRGLKAMGNMDSESE